MLVRNDRLLELLSSWDIWILSNILQQFIRYFLVDQPSKLVVIGSKIHLYLQSLIFLANILKFLVHLMHRILQHKLKEVIAILLIPQSTKSNQSTNHQQKLHQLLHYPFQKLELLYYHQHELICKFHLLYH